MGEVNKKQNNKIIILAIIGIIVILLIIGGIVVSSKMVKKDNKIDNTETKIVNKKEKEQEKEPKIEVDEKLLESLRMVIPKINTCSSYFFKQYNGDVFKREDLVAEELEQDYDRCLDAPTVYTVEAKIDSSAHEVYLYEYVLLSLNKFEEKSFDQHPLIIGGTYGNYTLSAFDVEYDINGTNKITDETLRKKGTLYKYTFLETDGSFAWLKTEAVKKSRK